MSNITGLFELGRDSLKPVETKIISSGKGSLLESCRAYYLAQRELHRSTASEGSLHQPGDRFEAGVQAFGCNALLARRRTRPVIRLARAAGPAV